MYEYEVNKLMCNWHTYIITFIFVIFLINQTRTRDNRDFLTKSNQL